MHLADLLSEKKQRESARERKRAQEIGDILISRFCNCVNICHAASFPGFFFKNIAIRHKHLCLSLSSSRSHTHTHTYILEYFCHTHTHHSVETCHTFCHTRTLCHILSHSGPTKAKNRLVFSVLLFVLSGLIISFFFHHKNT